MENKGEILDLLLPTLQATDYCYDLTDLIYVDHGNNYETVTAVFRNGYKVVANVSIDSGLAMIKDIIKALESH